LGHKKTAAQDCGNIPQRFFVKKIFLPYFPKTVKNLWRNLQGNLSSYQPLTLGVNDAIVEID